MNCRARIVATGTLLTIVAPPCSRAPADPPISLAGSRPKLAATTPGTRVVIAPTVVSATDTTREADPSGRVTYIIHAPPIAVCTTFPGSVSLDGAGNVYKQPVVTDAQGHERAVGAPVSLAAPKQIGGVTTTAKP